MDMVQGRVLTTAVLATWVALAAQPGPSQECVTWCDEADAPYLFVPGYAGPFDGVTKIQVTTGTPGGWLLGSDRISVAPLGGGQDDWPRLFTILGACAYKATVNLRAGTWHCDSLAATPGVTVGAGTVPDGTRLRGAPGYASKIVSTLAPTGGGGHVRAPFTRDDLSHPSNTTTLTANAVPGAVTISVTASAGIVDGATIFLGAGSNQAQSYTAVGAPAGGGPYVVTLDRELLYAFPSAGTTVGVYAEPRDIEISDLEFLGGTGDRAISLVAAWNCKGTRLRLISPRFSDYQLSFDTGQRFNEWDDIYVVDTTYPAIAIEAGEGTSMRHVTVDKCGSGDTAIVIQAAYDWLVSDCHVRQCAGAGIHVGWTSDVVGSRGGRIESSSFIGCVVGAFINGGSQGVDLIGNEFSYCSAYGVQVTPGGGATPDNVYGFGNRFVGNALHVLVDTATHVRFNNTQSKDATGTTAFQVQNGGKLEIDGIDASEDLVVFAFYSLAEMNVRNARFATTKSVVDPGHGNGVMVFRQENPGTRMVIQNIDIIAPAAKGVGLSVGSGLLIATDVKSAGLLYGSYVGGLGQAARIELRDGVDFSSASNPYTNDALGTHTRIMNRGAGTPEGAVLGDVGSTWVRTDGGVNTSFYVKEANTTVNGWVGK